MLKNIEISLNEVFNMNGDKIGSKDRIFEFCNECQQYHAHEKTCAICKKADKQREDVTPIIEDDLL